ncbi:hypothetical protein RC52_12700 [Herbaspirillum rubrisubalbicans]|nr:hypothetical protein [Herbaspirillum rubrisubalbicans]
MYGRLPPALSSAFADSLAWIPPAMAASVHACVSTRHSDRCIDAFFGFVEHDYPWLADARLEISVQPQAAR